MPPLGKMTMTQLRNSLSDTDDIMTFESEELLDAWIRIEEEHSRDGAMLNRLHFVLSTRMKDRGATALPHPTHDASYKSRRNTYDHMGFTPILELIPVETCIADGAYIAPYDENVGVVHHEASWNTVKAMTLKKYDPGVTAIIEKAKTPAPETLVIERKAPKD